MRHQRVPVTLMVVAASFHNTEMRKNHAVPKRSPFASAWAFVEDVGHLCRLK